MYDNIMVDSSLLETREKAQNGDIDAQLTIMRHVVDGNNAHLIQAESAEIFKRIVEDEKLEQDPNRVIKLLQISADIAFQANQNGQTSDAEYYEDHHRFLTLCLTYMVRLPIEEWPLYEMQGIINWLRENEDTIKEIL